MSPPLTPEQAEIVGLSDQITRLEEQAQDLEDRKCSVRASGIRDKIQALKTSLSSLVWRTE